MTRDSGLFLLTRIKELFRSSRIASAISFLTITICMVPVGMAFVVFWSAGQLFPSWITDMKTVVYLQADATPEAQDRIIREIGAKPEVREIVGVSKEQAWVRLRGSLRGWEEALRGIHGNPLPPSVEITFRKTDSGSETTDAILDEIRQYPEVVEVFDGKAWAERVMWLPHGMRYVAIAVVVFFSPVIVLAIFNAVKAAVLACRDELELYELVGATRSFMEAPFYVQGAIQGAMGAMAAGAVTVSGYCFVDKTFLSPSGFALFRQTSDIACFLLGLVCLGGGLGLIGSRLALIRLYRFR